MGKVLQIRQLVMLILILMELIIPITEHGMLLTPLEQM